MPERKSSAIIGDILNCIDRIGTYTDGLSFDGFSKNFMAVEACLIQNNLHSILKSPNINPAHQTIVDPKRKRKPYPIRFSHDNLFWKKGIMKARAKLVIPK